MNRFQKILIKSSVQIFLHLQAFMFRNKALHGLGYAINRSLAQTTINSKGIGVAKTLEDLGKNWQKGFPAKKQVPIVEIDHKTVYAEIHTPCPLRGTGDVQACYKMMSYDREIVKKAGGQFVVLESQAKKGLKHCRVAMRFMGEDMSDLAPAHKKQDDGLEEKN